MNASLCTVLVLAVTLGAPALFAQTQSTWNGGVGDWSVAGNWTPAVVPNNSADNVTIGVPGSLVMMNVLNESVHDVTLGSTDSLNVNAGHRPW